MAALTNEHFDLVDQNAREAAQNFTDWYYRTLNNSEKIATTSAYINDSPAYKALGQVADISIGGTRIAQPADYERALEIQRQVLVPASEVRGNSNTTATNGSTAAVNGSNAALVAKTEKITYEVEALDVHVANPDYRVGAPFAVSQDPSKTTGQRLMLLVAVDGYVKFGNKPGAQMSAFHEQFVLVPNWDVLMAERGGGSRSSKKYLILSQNFRRRGDE